MYMYMATINMDMHVLYTGIQNEHVHVRRICMYNVLQP